MRYIFKQRKFSFHIILIALAFLFTQCVDEPSSPPLSSEQQSDIVMERVSSTIVYSGIIEGAEYFISIPEPWNGDLIIYAHGYYATTETWTPDDKIGDSFFSDIVNDMQYAYATTSYRANGLVIREGVWDLVNLVDQFASITGKSPKIIYLVGASEGGLISTLAIEQYPNKFSGGLGLCGPIGDFVKQLNVIGDFRVVFDYFFPNVLPQWSPLNPLIPQYVIDNWDGPTGYEQAVKNAIKANNDKRTQLIKVTKTTVDKNDIEAVCDAVAELIWYNVFGTNNANDVLGGQPFDNSRKFYFGSKNDFKLNRNIQRFRADAAAINYVETFYQTSGILERPLVTEHTTGDHLTPYWHQSLYRIKTSQTGSRVLHTNMPVFKYGHCNFEIEDVLAGFSILVLKVTLQQLLVPETIFVKENSKLQFVRMAKQYGAKPMLAKVIERN
ncbi:MAG: alpha/beta hydrolase [Melioribacteraceae bacterium]|nr:alpha/beta hydrolase [Melioribacteraceae bacterium]